MQTETRKKSWTSTQIQNKSKKTMPLKNSSTNPVQAQTAKALMKKNYNLPKRRTKPLQKHKNDQTTEKIKKGRKILQNLLQPLITNNPDMSVSLRFDHQTQNRQLHLAFRRLPLTHLPKNNADLQFHLSFNLPVPSIWAFKLV